MLETFAKASDTGANNDSVNLLILAKANKYCDDVTARPADQLPSTRLLSHSSLLRLSPSSTPTSCSTSWWSQVRSFTSTASPTCRSSASRQERAAPRTADSSSARAPCTARRRAFFFLLLLLLLLFFLKSRKPQLPATDTCTHSTTGPPGVCPARVLKGAERGGGGRCEAPRFSFSLSVAPCLLVPSCSSSLDFQTHAETLQGRREARHWDVEAFQPCVLKMQGFLFFFKWCI